MKIASFYHNIKFKRKNKRTNTLFAEKKTGLHHIKAIVFA